jgi:hypothetical protein
MPSLTTRILTELIAWALIALIVVALLKIVGVW